MAEVTVEESRRKTAEFLGVDEDEVSYIDEESLAGEAVPVVGDADGGDIHDENQEVRSLLAAAQPTIVNANVTPNRIWYVSHFKYAGTDQNGYQLWWFYRDCTYTTHYWISTQFLNKYVADGSCRTPNGSFVPRYRMWHKVNPQTSAD